LDLDEFLRIGSLTELALAAIAFPLLFWITVPYGGRHTSERWGPTLPSAAAWFVMEIPAPVCFIAAYLQGDNAGEPASIVLAAGFLAHYFERAILQPLGLRSSTKRTPLLSASIAAVTNVMNGSIQGLAASHAHAFGSAWLVDPRFLLGGAMFVIGAWINRRSDSILRGLRAPGETGYKIPTGGLYRQVSSPNYLGEIVQWAGWALATWSLAGVAFFALTIANLAPRARSNHRWYLEQFPDYPAERRRLIPFVW
jgi:protein-S-isoprenylcysteine O-methyltransferase Ste14